MKEITYICDGCGKDIETIKLAVSDVEPRYLTKFGHLEVCQTCEEIGRIAILSIKTN